MSDDGFVFVEIEPETESKPETETETEPETETEVFPFELWEKAKYFSVEQFESFLQDMTTLPTSLEEATESQIKMFLRMKSRRS